MAKWKNDGVPVLGGFAIGDTFLGWCPFCRVFHVHGIDLDEKTRSSRELSHRVAHCPSEKSPFVSTGYYIRVFSKSEMKRFNIQVKKGGKSNG